MDCHSWSAWYNRMPGQEDPNLYVSGVCELRSSSIRLELRPGNEGIVDEPDLFVLELVIDEPEVGDGLMTTRDVAWSGEVGPDIRRVRIQGATTASMDVTEAS